MEQVILVSVSELKSIISTAVNEAVRNFEPNLQKVDSGLDWLTLKQLLDYDPAGRKAPTFYKLVNQRKIPVYKMGGKLAFRKSEIDVWLSSKKKYSADDLPSHIDKKLNSNQ